MTTCCSCPQHQGFRLYRVGFFFPFLPLSSSNTLVNQEALSISCTLGRYWNVHLLTDKTWTCQVPNIILEIYEYQGYVKTLYICIKEAFN